MSPGPRPRWRRRLLALLLGCALALCLVELGLRWLVLSDSALAGRLGASIRNPNWLASSNVDDYWVLQCRFNKPKSAYALWPDPLTGWLKGTIAAGTREHVDAPALGTRTPVLLYGDSFAEGAVSKADSFEGLLESSPLHTTHALLNYGVGGYGADQALLLARVTLPRWESRQSVAIMALLVDDDLDRAILGFRAGPKPRFHVANGKLVDPEPVETNLAVYLEQHPLEIRSYLANLFCHAPGLVPEELQAWLRGDESRLAEKLELSEPLVRATCRELLAHSQRSMILLTRTKASVRTPEKCQWQEELIRRVAAEEGMPVLDSRDVLLRAAGEGLERLDSLYLSGGPRVGHWNAQGNLVVFQLMRAFVEGGTTEDALAYVDLLVQSGELVGRQTHTLESTALGGKLFVQYREDAGRLCFMQPSEGSDIARARLLGVRAGNLGPSLVRWTIPPGPKRLTLSMRAGDAGPELPSAQAVLVHVGLRSEGGLEQSQTLRLQPGESAREWSVELAGGALEWSVESPAAGEYSLWVLVENVRLE